MDFEMEKLLVERIETHTSDCNVSAKEVVDEGARLINVTAFACCGRSELLNDEVYSEGYVKFSAILQVDDEIRKIERTERYNINEKINGIKPYSKLLSSASADKVRGYIEAGKLILSCNVRINSVIINSDETECVLELGGDDFRTKKENYSFNKTCFAENLRFSVSENSTFSPRVPEVKEVLSVASSICVKETHVTSGQLIVGGDVVLQTVYNSTDEYEPVVQVTDRFPFSHITDLKSELEPSAVNVSLCCEEIICNVSRDENGEARIVNYSLSLCGYAHGYKKETREVLSDTYSVSERLVCESCVVESYVIDDTIKENLNKNLSLKLPENKTPISRVNTVSFVPQVSFCQMLNSKIELHCKGDASVVYSASGSGEIDGFNSDVEFTVTLDCGNLTDALECISHLSLCDIQAVLVSGNEIEIRMNINTECYLISKSKIKLLGKMSVDEKNSFPEFGIIVYNIQPSDTLWDVCKKYGVDEDEILKLNPSAADKLEIGSKLYVFRKLKA